LPEMTLRNIPPLGNVRVSKGVISLKNDRGTSYKMYIAVQNELAAAINELRDELAMEKFGRKYGQLISEDQIKAIQKAIPVPISEAEPEDIGEN
ncbi:MAG: biopolymer transporter ExbD, partial [Bacteroidales bacterium]|nr:biopolymer transporter ExbD [Bacteroidales bacterium]